MADNFKTKTGLGLGLAILAELVTALRKGKLPEEEKRLFERSKNSARTAFYSGFLIGGGTGWAVFRALPAAWKLNNLVGLGLVGGIASFGTVWNLDRTIFSSMQLMISLDDTRLQREVAKIIVSRYQNYPHAMKLLYNHFYTEKVMDDSSMDNLLLRFRHRNVFEDQASHDHRRREFDLQRDSSTIHHEELNMEMKLAPVKLGMALEEDPIDCIFNYNAPSMQEMANPSIPSKPAGVSTRSHSHKRSHRKRRTKHQEV